MHRRYFRHNDLGDIVVGINWVRDNCIPEMNTMIQIQTRIYSWLMQMTSVRTTWSQKQIEAEHDRYLEQTMYQYHGINMYVEEMKR